MLEYGRIDISEGNDINKCEETSARCNLCKFMVHFYVMVVMICL